MTPHGIVVVITGVVLIMLLYWFKLRMMKRRLGLSILGLIITVFPTIGFFSVLHLWIEFYFKCRGDVQWQVWPSQNLIALMGAWQGRYVLISNLIIWTILTPVFFICLALLLKEWKNRRDESQAPSPIGLQFS